MSKPLTIQYTGKYANHLLREKDKEIERLRLDYEIQLSRANHLEERLKEVLKENEELRVELVTLRNNQVIFADNKEPYQKQK